MKGRLALLLLAAFAFAALYWSRQQTGTAAHDQALQVLIAEAGLVPLDPGPRPDPARVALGQALFFDKELSGNRDISCATCHHPDLATTDALALSIGTGGHGFGAARQPGDGRDFVPRNAQELFNRGAPGWEALFWDGRVAGAVATGYQTPAGGYLPDGLDNVLAAQALFPLGFRDEMRGGWYSVAGYAIQPGATLAGGEYQQPSGWHDVDIYGQVNELASIPNDVAFWPAVWDGVMDRLRAIPGYAPLFEAAYPGLPAEAWSISHAANALAAFQAEAFRAANTPWDRYLAGESSSLTTDAKAGALLFYGAAGCAECHAGPLLTDQQFHNIGAPQFGPGKDEFALLDYGRYAVTGDEADRFAFRTPPLRNVALTAPYLHNGAYNSLAAVIRHHLDPAAALSAYDGRSLSPALRPTIQDHPVTLANILATLDARLSEPNQLSPREIRQLVAFLQALTDPAAADMSHLVPDSVPSGLPVAD